MGLHRQVLWGGAGLAGALALLAWLPLKDDAVHAMGDQPPAGTSRTWAAVPRAAVDAQTTATPLARPAPWLALPFVSPAAAVPLTAVAPPKLLVGEISELVVSLGSNAGVGEISFTVAVDPNVLQLRAGTEGDWAAGIGVQARFAAEIASAEDRIQVRSRVFGRRLAGAGGGSVALLQFQAVAPGSTSVIISDVTVKDLAGNAMPFSLPSANLQVTAESIPPPATPS